MSAFIDENTQFVDSSGKPIVNGKLYVGTKGLDPVNNPITIYSDRSLTTVLANPQLLDADGRSANKIWIPALYSFRVDNTNDVQQLQDLDAGNISTTGVTSLFDIQGTNSITGIASPTIEAYVDGEVYVFQPANTNTGATTLNIDSLGAKDLNTSGAAFVGGELLAGINYAFSYNLDNDNFDLLGNTGGIKLWSGSITYSATNVVFGSEGMLYFSRAAGNLNNNPVTGTGNEWIAADQIRNIVATGTVDTITATFIPALGALRNGFTCRVRATGANATTAPTFAPNGLTAKTIVKKGDQPLAVGDIFGEDHELSLIYNSSNDTWELLNPGGSAITIGSLVDTSTTATSYTIAIPLGVKRIRVLLNGVSTNGASRRQISIGDSGGLETSGYTGIISNDIDDTVDAFSSGYIFELGDGATSINFGTILLSLIDPATNTWIMSCDTCATVQQRTFSSSGVKALTGELTQINLGTENGTDTFDAGSINVQYES